MTMFNRYIISESSSLLDALKAINAIERGEAFTLFVSDSDNRIVGTLTDGDVRRSLIDGKNLSSSVSDVANRKFTYLKAGNYDVKQIHIAKKKALNFFRSSTSKCRLWML